MRSCAFGIVVLGGMRALRRTGTRIRTEAKFNMAFEYGMLVGMGVPLLVLLVKEERLNLKSEFSDLDGEVHKKVQLDGGPPLRVQLEEILRGFSEDLPRLLEERWTRLFSDLPPRDRKAALAAVRALTDVEKKVHRGSS